MLTLLYTTGSPFARAVRILLHELGLDFTPQEELSAPREGALVPPTLQVPALRDGDLLLWDSGTIADYLLARSPGRRPADPPLAATAFRDAWPWKDRLTFATIQTFGTTAATISQLRWTGIGVADNAHLARSADRLSVILAWLETRLPDPAEGFQPGVLSIHDIFLAAHVRFVQARPLGIDLALARHPKLAALLDRLDRRESFRANPVWWWEPGIAGYEPDGTPIREEATPGRA